MPKPLVKFVRRFDRVLPGHRVGDEQNLAGVQQIFELRQLRHQVVVDVQTSRSIDQQHIAPGLHRFLACGPRQVERLGLLRRPFINRNLQIASQHAQLFPRRGTIDVDRNHDRRLGVLRQIPRQLAGRGRFTGPLQPDDHDDTRRLIRHAQLGLMRAEHLDHLVAHNFDDLLRGGQRRKYFLPHGFFANGFDELLGDAKMHVGLKQRDADLAQRGVHIFRREFPFSAQGFKNPLEFIA